MFRSLTSRSYESKPARACSAKLSAGIAAIGAATPILLSRSSSGIAHVVYTCLAEPSPSLRQCFRKTLATSESNLFTASAPTSLSLNVRPAS